ncbi:hypothetical protein N0V82_003860 [Gnomoniopsis sp. IMI 355080]|nr:hypothetical protein N0V82_003860 [Gnomoniopsis sp. IMI 355080]
MSGTVQLSKKVESSLLSTFRQNNPKANMKTALKEPNNVDDLPMTTDDEDQPSSPDRPFVDSSDDDVHCGDIQRTNFKQKMKSNQAIAANTANGRPSTAKEKDSIGLAGSAPTRRSIRRTEAKKRTKDDIEHDAEDRYDLFASKKAKTDSKNLTGQVGAHMTSEGFILSKPTAQRGYGRKSQNSTPHGKLKMRSFASDSTPKKEPKFKNKYAAITSSAKQTPIRRAREKGKKKASECSPEPMSQRPQFKMPDAYNNYAPSAQLVDLDVQGGDKSVEKERHLDPGMALCPMCDEQVDEKLLQEFSNGERMKLVRQVKFCRMHKKVSAQKTWDEKGYPVINWASLHARIEGHFDFLKSIIMGTRSYHGDLLRENIRTGQARTLLTTKDYLTPGYYGLRGMSVMTEAVTDVFSNLLRKRAPLDTRISGRGYTGFVQSVLVPELAVKLIQEDLSLGEDHARKVMTESRAVGEILNDEKRHSQSQAPMQMYGEEKEEKEEGVKDDNGDDTASVSLAIEQAADAESVLSSPLSYSQSPTPAKAEEANDSDSDESFASFGGRRTDKQQVIIKKQDVITLPSRAFPSSRNMNCLTPDKMDEVDDGDVSSLASF